MIAIPRQNTFGGVCVERELIAVCTLSTCSSMLPSGMINSTHSSWCYCCLVFRTGQSMHQFIWLQLPYIKMSLPTFMTWKIEKRYKLLDLKRRFFSFMLHFLAINSVIWSYNNKTMDGSKRCEWSASRVHRPEEVATNLPAQRPEHG